MAPQPGDLFKGAVPHQQQRGIPVPGNDQQQMDGQHCKDGKAEK